jgi:hypothetical protein
MIYYETLLFFLIVLSIIPLIVGFLFKNRAARYFWWLISLPFLSITVLTIHKHSSDIDKQTKEFLGEYHLDTNISIYKHGDLTTYRGLTLNINSDKSFVFGDTSVFLSVKGTWKFYSTEDGGFVRCRFPNSTYETEVIAGGGLWGFRQRFFKNGSDGDVIYFRKDTVIKE